MTTVNGQSTRPSDNLPTGSQPSVAKNSLFVLSARILEAVVGLVVILIVARCLGVELFGRYSLILAVVWVLSPLLALRCTPHIIIREIVKDRTGAQSLIGSSIVLSTLLAVPVAVLAFFAGWAFHLDGPSFAALFITIGYFLLKTWISELTSIYIAVEKMHYEAIASYCVSFFELLAVSLVFVMKGGFLAVFLATAGANLLALAVILVMVRKFRIRMATDKIRYLFRESLPLAGSRLFTQAYLYVDVFILKVLTTDLEVGLFQSSQRIVVRLLILPMSLGMSMMPRFSRMAIEPTGKELKQMFDQWFKAVLFLSLLITFTGYALSEEIIKYLYGSSFSRATVSLELLFFAVPFFFLNYLAQITNIACGKQIYVLAAEGLAFASDFALDIALIPSFGYMGASWATLCGAIVLCVVDFSLIPKYLKTSRLLTVAGQSVAAFCAAFFLFRYLASWNKGVALASGVMVYAGVLIMTNFFSSEDMQTVKKVFGVKTAV